MASIPQIHRSDWRGRIERIQAITIGWMIVEVVVSLFASWKARSPALLAFGGDSGVELLSAVVVLWEFRSNKRSAKMIAARTGGVLLFALAGYVTTVSLMTLHGENGARPTYVGMAILIAAAVIMPWLSREKRKLSVSTDSAALRADATQSGLCAYLSLIALVGIFVNAVWHISWMDPAAALAIIPLILWEGRQAFRGKSCGCC